jgi:hypothetical protein
MAYFKTVMVGVGIGVVATLIDGFFIGFLFHKYQKETPNTWRQENIRSYITSTIVSIFFGILFASFYSLFVATSIHNGFGEALEVGAFCWATFLLPEIIGTSIYVNLHRMFVIGKCVSSFVVLLAASAISVWLL